MLSQKCQWLWDVVKTRCTPLGQPRDPNEPRLVVEHGPDTIDLHHLTIRDAHARVEQGLRYGARTMKEMTVITGRSGEIRREFPSWADLHPNVRRIEPLNGGGAFRVILRP